MEIALQDGDGRLHLTEVSATEKEIIIPRASQAAFSGNDDWLIGMIYPEKDSNRQIKL